MTEASELGARLPGRMIDVTFDNLIMINMHNAASLNTTPTTLVAVRGLEFAKPDTRIRVHQVSKTAIRLCLYK